MCKSKHQSEQDARALVAAYLERLWRMRRHPPTGHSHAAYGNVQQFTPRVRLDPQALANVAVSPTMSLKWTTQMDTERVSLSSSCASGDDSLRRYYAFPDHVP